MHILIADDNVEVLDTLAKFLEENQHTYERAVDGVDALEKYQKGHHDGVYAGLTMPKMGGIELLKELKRLNAHLPFVIISRHGDSDNILTCLNLGACDFLTKPLKNSELNQSVNRVKSLMDDSRFSVYCLENSVFESRTLEIGNDFEYINKIVSFITRNLPSYQLLEEEDLFTMNIILSEAVENAMFHGNLEISSELKKEKFEKFRQEGERRRVEEQYKARKVYIHTEITRNSVKYVIRDDGRGFDYSSIPDPKDPENLFKVSGRGILLIMNFMDEVFWNERGNEITMVRYKKRTS
ncbi:MAG: response regulator [SAR324 cluster bacterium]|nr:response regulator [SAR324 cluster bacterium]